MEELGNLGFVGIADDEGDAGKSGEFFGGTLGVAAGDNDASRGIGGVEFADGVAGLRVGGGGDGAGVEDDDVGDGRVRGKGKALLAELALDGGAVGLRGAAAELLDKESAHRRNSGHPYLIIREASSAEGLRTLFCDARGGGLQKRKADPSPRRRRPSVRLRASGDSG